MSAQLNVSGFGGRRSSGGGSRAGAGWPGVTGRRPHNVSKPQRSHLHNFNDHIHILLYLRINITQHNFFLACFLFYLMSSILAEWPRSFASATHDVGWGGALEKNVSVLGTPSLPLQSYYGIFLMIKKSRRAKCPPNRQLHAAAKASKSLPDRCSADQGGKERHRERRARRNK